MDLPAVSPRLPGDGVLLAPWEDRDLPRILELAEDPATRAFSGSLAEVRTLEDARAWLERRSGQERVDWAVRDPATGELIGRCGLQRFDDPPRSAEVGYGVHPSYRGRGVAVAAVATATTWAFAAQGLRRVWLVHDVANPASCAVAARAGFRLEGVERAAMGYADGRVADQHRHARLADDPDGPPAATSPVEPVEIAAGRLQLRPPQAQDAASAWAMLADPQVQLWNPTPEVVDLDSAREWCRGMGDWSDGSHATFSVLDATGGDLLGMVSLHRIDRRQQDAELGYRVAPWARGNGVATAAVAAVGRWAFGAVDLLRVEICHAVANAPSCRVAEKAGFPLEGTLRQAYVYGDGRRYDEHLHARLRTDA